MAYDLRRAALVTSTLLALLLAATLMPAANLGSFPGAGGGPASGDATTGLDGAPTPEPVTVTTAESGPPPGSTTTTTTTTTSTTTTTTQAAASPGTDDGDGLGSALGSLVLALVGAALVGVGGYATVVLLAATTFGVESVSCLPFSGTIRAVPQLTMSTLIGTSSVTAEFLGGLRATLGGLGTGLRAAASVPASLGAALAKAPLLAMSGFATGIGGVFGALGGAMSNLSLGLGRRSGREQEPAATEDAREAEGPDPEDPADPEPLSITEAYDLLTDELPLANERARTPGEVARAAVDRGWPEEPVEGLVSTFREVRYGGRPETDERTGRARSAIRRLREFWGGSG